MVIVPKKRLILFIILYFITTIFTVTGYMIIEGWSFFDSFWHTIINVVAFGGINFPADVSKLGMLFTVFAKMVSLFCVAGIIYSALQASIFERVDRITYERIRQAKEKPINIFLSYRRVDSSGHTGRIYDRLSSFFGSSHVFMDIDTIAPGEDFLRIIQSAISSCEIMVAVIGDNWIGLDGQKKKIFQTNDFVRIEIEYALQNHIQIVPVLVNGARMPIASDIPEGIIALLSQQAVEISDTRWNHDVQKLIDSIDSIRKKNYKPSKLIIFRCYRFNNSALDNSDRLKSEASSNSNIFVFMRCLISGCAATRKRPFSECPFISEPHNLT